MSRTLLTTILVAQNNYAIQPGSPSPYVPGDLLVTFASDFVNGNYFIATGNEIVLVQNADSVTHNFTALSTPDHLGRTNDLIYPVAAGTIVALEFSVLEGWVQSDSSVSLNPTDTHIKFAVLRFS
jgi:hypothetical protein